MLPSYKLVEWFVCIYFFFEVASSHNPCSKSARDCLKVSGINVVDYNLIF